MKNYSQRYRCPLRVKFRSDDHFFHLRLSYRKRKFKLTHYLN